MFLVFQKMRPPLFNFITVMIILRFLTQVIYFCKMCTYHYLDAMWWNVNQLLIANFDFNRLKLEDILSFWILLFSFKDSRNSLEKLVKESSRTENNKVNKYIKNSNNPLNGCRFVYLDMGSNVGIQIRCN